MKPTVTVTAARHGVNFKVELRLELSVSARTAVQLQVEVASARHRRRRWRCGQPKAGGSPIVCGGRPRAGCHCQRCASGSEGQASVPRHGPGVCMLSATGMCQWRTFKLRIEMCVSSRSRLLGLLLVLPTNSTLGCSQAPAQAGPGRLSIGFWNHRAALVWRSPPRPSLWV